MTQNHRIFQLEEFHTSELGVERIVSCEEGEKDPSVRVAPFLSLGNWHEVLFSRRTLDI
jgi:hypothetical protein